MLSNKKLITIFLIVCVLNIPFADAAAGDCGNASQMPTDKKCCCAASSSTIVKVTGVSTCEAITCGGASVVSTAVITACSENYAFAAGPPTACTACTGNQVAPAGSTGACVDCPTGTTTCTAAGTTASPTFTAVTCAAGYLKPATGPCTACPSGQGSSAANTSLTCVSCGTNAATCTVAAGTSGANGAVTQVNSCKSGFALKDAVSPSTIQTCEALPATAPAGCTQGTITGAGNTFACTECGADGYATGAPSGATPACSACTAVANCGACGATAAGTCTRCKNGFYNSAAAGAAMTCVACAAGCATCPDGADGATKCSTVKKGYQLSAAAPATPAMCGGDGKTSTSATSTACDVACPANCNTCNEDSTKCDVCNANFELDANKACVAIADADRHPTCASANKKSSADGCLSCQADQNREQPEDPASTTTPKAKLTKCVCKAGFGDKSALKTPDYVCAACPENATACTFDDAGLKTVTCKTGFFAAGVACLDKAATNVNGYFFDSVSSTFKACHASCLTCTTAANNGCSKCQEAPSTWVEPKQDAANYQTYIKGTRWLNNSMCYDDCPTGFVANEARNGCEEAGFSTGLFSLIFVILSIFISL